MPQGPLAYCFWAALLATRFCLHSDLSSCWRRWLLLLLEVSQLAKQAIGPIRLRCPLSGCCMHPCNSWPLFRWALHAVQVDAAVLEACMAAMVKLAELTLQQLFNWATIELVEDSGKRLTGLPAKHMS